MKKLIDLHLCKLEKVAEFNLHYVGITNFFKKEAKKY